MINYTYDKQNNDHFKMTLITIKLQVLMWVTKVCFIKMDTLFIDYHLNKCIRFNETGFNYKIVFLGVLKYKMWFKMRRGSIVRFQMQ